MSRYSAQKQFWKAKQAKHEDKIADVVLLQKLQVQPTHTHTSTQRCVDSQIKLFDGNIELV